MEKNYVGRFLSGVNVDTGRDKIEYIPIGMINPDPENFYELSGLDGLASNIALCGLQQPLRVRPDPDADGQYRILSGHRRHAALKLLIAEGREDLNEVACIVERAAFESPEMTKLKLIYANSNTRVLSPAEQAKQIQQVQDLLYALKEQGQDFPGRMRDHVAEICRISTGKMARLKVITNGLAPSLKADWESGKLKESVAYELARIPEADQEAIAHCKHTASYLQASTVEEMHRDFEMVRNQECPKEPCGVCYNASTMINKMRNTAQYSPRVCAGSGCCLKCSSLERCGSSCRYAADKKQKLLKASRERREEEKERTIARDTPIIDFITGVYARLVEQMERKKLRANEVQEAMKVFPETSADTHWRKLAKGKDVTPNTGLPFGYGGNNYYYFQKLVQAADKLDCTTDYLLGRTEVPEPGSPAGWYTEPPEAEGKYAVWLEYSGIDSATWHDGRWLYYGQELSADCEIDSVLAWTELPEGFV